MDCPDQAPVRDEAGNSLGSSSRRQFIRRSLQNFLIPHGSQRDVIPSCSQKATPESRLSLAQAKACGYRYSDCQKVFPIDYFYLRGTACCALRPSAGTASRAPTKEITFGNHYNRILTASWYQNLRETLGSPLKKKYLFYDRLVYDFLAAKSANYLAKSLSFLLKSIFDSKIIQVNKTALAVRIKDADAPD